MSAMRAKETRYVDATTSLVVGTQEIAELLEVKPATVSQWKFRKILPPPDYPLRCGDVWLRHTIERWARVTNRWTRGDDAVNLHVPEGWIPPEGGS